MSMNNTDTKKTKSVFDEDFEVIYEGDLPDFSEEPAKMYFLNWQILTMIRKTLTIWKKTAPALCVRLTHRNIWKHRKKHAGKARIAGKAAGFRIFSLRQQRY